MAQPADQDFDFPDATAPPKPAKPRANWASRNRVNQIVCAAVAGVCVFLAFEQPAPRSAVWAGLACCAAVFSRIWQAEAHYERK